MIILEYRYVIPAIFSIRNKIETQNPDKQRNETVQGTPTNRLKIEKIIKIIILNGGKCAKHSMFNVFNVILP